MGEEEEIVIELGLLIFFFPCKIFLAGERTMGWGGRGEDKENIIFFLETRR